MKKLDKLTDDELNKIIAKRKKWVVGEGPAPADLTRDHERPWGQHPVYGRALIPNYAKQRNSTLHLLPDLDHTGRRSFVQALHCILDRDLSSPAVEWSIAVTDPVDIAVELLMAAPRQLAEAFVLSQCDAEVEL